MERKKKLQEEYIKAIEQKLKKAKKSYEVAKKDTIEAEGRMITRYDSTKTETAWLADGYLEEVKELEKVIEREKNDIEYVNVFDTVQLDKFENEKYIGLVTVNLEKDKIEDELFYALLGSYINDIISLDDQGNKIGYQVRKITKSLQKDVACIGSLITTKDDDDYEDKFYIVNQIGGIELEIEQEEIFCVSKQALMAIAFLGKKIGDSIIANPKTKIKYTITCIE